MAGQFTLHRVGQHLAGAVEEPGTEVVLGIFDAGEHGVDHLTSLRGHLGSDAVAGDHRDPRHAHVHSLSRLQLARA